VPGPGESVQGHRTEAMMPSNGPVPMMSILEQSPLKQILCQSNIKVPMNTTI
jgi:hypothetical protein